MKSRIFLSIIIVSYNTKNMTIECLRSVIEGFSRDDFELIVFDNNSSDGTVEAIVETFPQVKLIPSMTNLGFAAGNNLAAKHASGEYFLLLNPDTVVLDDAIQNLLEFAQHNPEAGIWGGRTVFGDHSLNPASCWRKMTLWNVFCRSFGLARLLPTSCIFNSEAYGGWDRSTVRQVDIVSGCFFMLKQDLWVQLGGFSSDFFMYGEEADLCMRASKFFGAKPMVTPDATIVHYGGASEKIQADKMVRLLKSKRLLMERHWPKWKYQVGMLIYPLYPFNKALALKVAGFFKSKKHNGELSDWLEIWKRRKEWL